MKDHLAKQLAEIKANGLYKVERTIITPQSSAIRIAERSGKVLNFCANNYLGLSDNPRLISAAKKAMDSQSDCPLFPDRGHDSLCSLFRCQRRRIRTLIHRRGCHHLGCAQPCIDHRRCTPLQSQTLSLRQCRHGRTRTVLAGSTGSTIPYHRHRRSILDGR